MPRGVSVVNGGVLANAGEASRQGSSSSDYGRDYYDEYGRLGPSVYSRENPLWLRHFGNAADQILSRLNPHSVLDVGCAKGFLVECLRDRGAEAYGLDISEYAINEVRADIRPYCLVGSAIDSIDRDYDLITCIEVCEHMSESEATETVRQIGRHAGTILFSSTPSNFAEPTHINVRPIIDWLRLFAECSFAPDEAFDATFLSRQAVLFRRVSVVPSDQSLCRFAHFRTRAVIEAEMPDAEELATIRKELEHMQQSRAWRLVTRYGALRLAINRSIVDVLRRIGVTRSS